MKLGTLRRCSCGRYMNQSVAVSSGTACQKERKYAAPYAIRLIDLGGRLRSMMKSRCAPRFDCRYSRN
jgi:hypothetical protein